MAEESRSLKVEEVVEPGVLRENPLMDTLRRLDAHGELTEPWAGLTAEAEKAIRAGKAKEFITGLATQQRPPPKIAPTEDLIAMGVMGALAGFQVVAAVEIIPQSLILAGMTREQVEDYFAQIANPRWDEQIAKSKEDLGFTEKQPE